jgi:hypothetical protein
MQSPAQINVECRNSHTSMSKYISDHISDHINGRLDGMNGSKRLVSRVLSKRWRPNQRPQQSACDATKHAIQLSPGTHLMHKDVGDLYRPSNGRSQSARLIIRSRKLALIANRIVRGTSPPYTRLYRKAKPFNL